MHLEELRTLLQSVEPAAHLVEPRVLRRVIRIDRRMQGFRLVIPHESSYTIDRDRLLAFVELDELFIEPGSDLPRRLILLPQPDADELADDANRPAIITRYHRALYHACVHLELENNRNRSLTDDTWAAERRRQLGEVEFAEIHDVLSKEGLLFHAPTDAETYIEFAAVALELTYFAPRELANYFPSIRDWDRVDEILEQDVDPAKLDQQLQSLEIGNDAHGSIKHNATSPDSNDSTLSSQRISLVTFRKLQAKASQAARVGNIVKAALTHQRISRIAPDSGYEREAIGEASRELANFTKRWQKILRLEPDADRQWFSAIKPLLVPASEGLRSNEARLLRDLQKVCIEQERGIFRIDLIGWIRTFGKRAIRRPLPLMQDVLALRYLRTARRRVGSARIAQAEQAKLENLIDLVAAKIEARSRDQMRSIINRVFDDVGFKPDNTLETVARQKLVEELLDRIVEQSYLTMTDLRDAISKNDLKLADVTQLSELFTGDYLLQADRQFDTALDGVYRRGSLYLRGPQLISSLVFGTGVGRTLTKRLIVPFGGAYLLLEFLRHLHLLFGFGKAEEADSPVSIQNVATQVTNPVAEVAPPAEPQWMFWTGVLLLGTWLSLLIQRPEFRAWNQAMALRAWNLIRHMVVELPAQIVNSELVRKILESRTFAIVRSYVLEPGATVGVIAAGMWLFRNPLSRRTILEVFLATALFLNSPIGRYVSERTFDFLMRAWLELKMQVFSAILQAIVDVFDRLASMLSRVVYTVDDWLRFRAGDNRGMQAVKLVGGVVWFFVSYVIVFVFTLLVEPQINPIKHFPVVTVSHKVLLPTIPRIAKELTPYLGGTEAAYALVTTVITLLPGVFGFLVWELKENWRLYAANRSPRLGPQAIGHHDETMLRLLRPGFHSGTLPKAFASLRRPSRSETGWLGGRRQRKAAVITHAEEAVQHFVERELVALLEKVDFPDANRIAVGPVHAGTNRIDVTIREIESNDAGRLTWEYLDGKLTGQFDPLPWLDSLDTANRQTFLAALEKLFQRSGVDAIRCPLPLSAAPHRNWDEAVAFWDSQDRKGIRPQTREENVAGPHLGLSVKRMRQ